ncbi:hypothetical protein HK405_007226 [Cladochytrium tenue]|nr:hypothetical protein HK405_007226 [Cladochytrium tenue]
MTIVMPTVVEETTSAATTSPTPVPTDSAPWLASSPLASSPLHVRLHASAAAVPADMAALSNITTTAPITSTTTTTVTKIVVKTSYKSSSPSIGAAARQLPSGAVVNIDLAPAVAPSSLTHEPISMPIFSPETPAAPSTALEAHAAGAGHHRSIRFSPASNVPSCSSDATSTVVAAEKARLRPFSTSPTSTVPLASRKQTGTTRKRPSPPRHIRTASTPVTELETAASIPQPGTPTVESDHRSSTVVTKRPSFPSLSKAPGRLPLQLSSPVPTACVLPTTVLSCTTASATFASPTSTSPALASTTSTTAAAAPSADRESSAVMQQPPSPRLRSPLTTAPALEAISNGKRGRYQPGRLVSGAGAPIVFDAHGGFAFDPATAPTLSGADEICPAPLRRTSSNPSLCDETLPLRRLGPTHSLAWSVASEKGYKTIPSPIFGILPQRVPIHPNMEDVHLPVLPEDHLIHATNERITGDERDADDRESDDAGSRASLSSSSTFSSTGAKVFVLADGHGGVNAARFFVPRVRAEITRLVRSRDWDFSRSDDQDVFESEATRVCMSLDAEYCTMQLAVHKKWVAAGSAPEERPADDGCTLIATIICDGWLINLNVGDSRTVVYSRPSPDMATLLLAATTTATAGPSAMPGTHQGVHPVLGSEQVLPEWVPVFSSVDHNMMHPVKVHSIRTSGGYFLNANGSLKNVHVTHPDARNHRPYAELAGARIYRPPTERVRQAGVSHRRTLNLTATMGDLLFKLEPAVLSAAPDVRFVRLLDGRDYAVVMASDGVWDHLHVQDEPERQNNCVMNVLTAAVEHQELAAATRFAAAVSASQRRLLSGAAAAAAAAVARPHQSSVDGADAHATSGVAMVGPMATGDADATTINSGGEPRCDSRAPSSPALSLSPPPSGVAASSAHPLRSSSPASSSSSAGSSSAAVSDSSSEAASEATAVGAPSRLPTLAPATASPGEPPSATEPMSPRTPLTPSPATSTTSPSASLASSPSPPSSPAAVAAAAAAAAAAAVAAGATTNSGPSSCKTDDTAALPGLAGFLALPNLHPLLSALADEAAAADGQRTRVRLPPPPSLADCLRDAASRLVVREPGAGAWGDEGELHLAGLSRYDDATALVVLLRSEPVAPPTAVLATAADHLAAGLASSSSSSSSTAIPIGHC